MSNLVSACCHLVQSRLPIDQNILNHNFTCFVWLENLVSQTYGFI
jgi:hypothetical protein